MGDAFDRLKAAAEDVKAGRVTAYCPRCAVAMKPGQAIKETVRGADDFPGADVVTYSVGGPGKLVTCWKCPTCGESKEADPASLS